ncbi:glycosyltransferase family protein [Fulvivirgaceae bacterium BMA10]|uniref:Glycosyltransferase family protein n=1 Tax=Splendidivirga corallicola TaxID=3051826 RepID=A0ABT8KVX8_9BACT|nr:glycosyltransferase family protein [Fulvivirgaceae bacterium BMA10]
MKILYAIQGTGNGHLSRARDIIPVLQKQGDLDILVSGIQADVSIPYEIKYRLKGLSFIFGKQGGVDIWKTYLKSNSRRLQKEIKSLPIQDYDLIINDFEPVSAWAAYLKGKPCIGLSHQAAVIDKDSPKPKKTDRTGKLILRHYAPTSQYYGFHFQSYNDNIFTPVIRKQIRNLDVTNDGHFTVYLPAYSDKKLIKVLSEIKEVKWEVFSKHNKKPVRHENIYIQPVTNESFIESFASCSGILCGAGFETPAEALYLNKKLMVIPMKGQYEQHCNAAAVKAMGVPVLKSLKKKRIDKIKDWINNGEIIKVNYPDITEHIIDKLIRNFSTDQKTTFEQSFDPDLQLIGG